MSSLLEKAKALRANAENAKSAVSAENPRVPYRPAKFDYELAGRLGPEGSRQQYLDAVHLVAELAGREPWNEADAMDALARWWGRPVDDLSPVELIVSAAHVDEVVGSPRPRAAGGAP